MLAKILQVGALAGWLTSWLVGRLAGGSVQILCAHLALFSGNATLPSMRSDSLRPTLRARRRCRGVCSSCWRCERRPRTRARPAWRGPAGERQALLVCAAHLPAANCLLPGGWLSCP